jgi:hypothetical protein
MRPSWNHFYILRFKVYPGMSKGFILYSSGTGCLEHSAEKDGKVKFILNGTHYDQ